nr:PREDICTED: uncharacterized protein LOC109040866 [Bemisia tabaci]
MAVVKEEKPEVFFEENETDIFEDDDIVSELIGCSGEESTSSTVLKYILNINEAFNLSSEDIDLLKRIKNRLDDTCVPLDAQERLTRINIKIDWTVPVQHTLESNISGEVSNPRNLLKELKKMNLDVEMDTNRFTEEEDRSIEARWTLFSTEYNFPDPGCFIAFTRFGGCLPKHERVKFAQYLGKDLPNRFLCSILHRFSQLYGKWIQRKYSKEEDQLLLHIKEKNFIKYKSIVSSLMLNRTSNSVITRTYKLSTPKEILYGKERRKWRGFRDDERLIMYLMRKTGSKTLADLETKTIQITHFTGAARKLHCHILTALSRWKFRLSTQLFASAPLYKYELCIKLIKWLKEKNYGDWNDIDWPELCSDLHNCQKNFLAALFRSIITKFDAYYRSYRYDFRKCINYLYETALPYFEDKLSSDININRYRLNRVGYLVAVR